MSSSGISVGAITARIDRLPLGLFHVALIAAVFTGLAFEYMDQVVLSFVIPRYREEWHLSAQTAAINPMTGLATTFVGALFWGTVADRIGRKRTLMITLGIYAVTMAVNGFAWSFPQLVLTCIVMGFGIGGTIPLGFTLLAECTPARHRGMLMVLVGVLSLVGGYVIASGSAVLLIDAFGWRSLFLVGVAPLALLPLIAWAVPESPRYLLARGRTDEALRVVERLERGRKPSGPVLEPSEPGLAEDAPAEGTVSFRTVGRLWRSGYGRRTAMLWAYAFAFGFFTFGFVTWLPTVLKEAGFDEPGIHVHATVMDLFAIPSAAVTAYLFFRWSTKGTLVLFPAVAGVAMLALSTLVGTGLLTSASLLIVGGTVFAFGTILLGVFGPYASEVYPTGMRGTGSGWATGMSRFGALTGIPVGGLVLSSGLPLFAHQIVFGVPLLAAAAIMAAFGVETRGRRLEDLTSARAGAWLEESRADPATG